MMASHLSDGCHKAGERVNCSMEVYLSVDFGKTWKPVTSYVAQFDWGPAVDGVLKAGMQKESMFLVTYEKKEGARRPPLPIPPPFSPSALSSASQLASSSSRGPRVAITHPTQRPHTPALSTRRLRVRTLPRRLRRQPAPPPNPLKPQPRP